MTTLSDIEIEAEIKAGRLIRNANLEMLEGACYQLRLGRIYYDLTEGGRRFALSADQTVLIKPGHRVVLITEEELAVPPNVLVRVVSKGSLFSVGLGPVATYADPGFSGNLGIVTHNTSDKYIELPPLEAIAKAEFNWLTTPSTRLYAGQHGFSMGIWPLKTHLQKSYSDVAGDWRVTSEKEEALMLLPSATRSVIKRIELTQTWTDFALIVAIMLNALTLFFISGKLVDNIIGIVGNLVASSILGAGVVYAKLAGRSAKWNSRHLSGSK